MKTDFVYLMTYKNSNDYKAGKYQMQYINRNFIVSIALIKVDAQDKNSEELFQIKMIDGSNFVVSFMHFNEALLVTGGQL